MRKIYIFAALVLAAAVSCSKEVAPIEKISPDVVPEGYVPVTLTAQLDPETKATMNGKIIMWEVGEEVAVFANGAGDPIPFKVIAINTNGSYDGVQFGGSVPEGTETFIAAYPYQEEMKCAEGVVTMSIPSEQVIPEGKVIAPNAFASVAYFASASSLSQFRNVMSLIEFNVGQTQNVSEVDIYYKGESGSAGDISVTVGDGSQAPVIANACKSFAKVVCDFVPGTNYYAAVAPAANIEGFSVYALAGAKASVKEATREKEDPIVIERNKGLNLGDITATEAYKYLEITKVDELAEFLAAADTYPNAWEVRVMNDIDCSGAQIAPAANYGGVFDGQGFTLNNLTVSNALFANLKKGAEVKNVKVNNGVINWTDPVEDMTGIAFIASASKGKVIDCEVKGDITVNTPTAGRIYCAGVVGESTTGYVYGCKFSGNIDVTLGTSASCSAIAGVAARVGNKAMAEEVIVRDCVNEGNIKFLFNGKSGDMKKFGIGGVIGQTPSVANADTPMGIITDCVNKGNIEWSYPEGGSGSYPALGGVAGIVEGELHNSSNYGDVKYTGDMTKVKAATDASIGGVAGYVTCGASNCHNYGKVSTEAYFAGGTSMAQSGGNSDYSTFGGVFGNAGPYAANKTNKAESGITVSNCSNEGVLDIIAYMVNSGGPQMCFGGVIGYSSANVSNCENKGEITIKTQTKTVNAGGIVGFMSANIDNCSNSGKFVVDGCQEKHPSSVTAQNYVGGIYGQIVSKGIAENLSNTGDITLQNVFTVKDVLNYVGGIGGSYSGGFKMTNAENSGTISCVSDSPVCLGGLFGAVNGILDGLKNSGEVIYPKTYCSDVDGKQPEVGGIAGYAYTEGANNFENTGKLTNAAEGGSIGGLFGSHNPDAGRSFEWSNCTVNCTIEGAATAGSLLGKFRYAYTDKTKAPATIKFGTAEGPVKVEGDAAVLKLPLVGNANGNVGMPINVIVGGEPYTSYEGIKIFEDLDNNYFIYEGKKYPVVKLADDRWWMAAPLAYVPEGKTVSADPVEDSGIWYTYDTDGTNCTARTDFTDGYLYDIPTAFGVKVEDITFGTKADYQAGTNVGNFRQYKGTQGICPPGWYIPLKEDFNKLCGACNKDDSVEPAEPALDDPTALYYVTDYKGSTVKKFNEAGWNFSFLGVRGKTSTAQTGAYNKAATDATKCSVPEWIPKSALNQILSSTPYMPNAAGNNVQFFCLMSTFTAAYPDGRLSVSYTNLLQGVEVRCIRKAEEAAQ